MLNAKDLGITESEYDALILVRDLLANGSIEHRSRYFPGEPEQVYFNMNYAKAKIITDDRTYQERENVDCGTVACIAGWMSIVNHQVRIDKLTELSHPLNNLFFPNELSDYGDDGCFLIESSWGHITVPQAVRAIDNVLNTGEPNWREVVREEKTNE